MFGFKSATLFGRSCSVNSLPALPPPRVRQAFPDRQTPNVKDCFCTSVLTFTWLSFVKADRPAHWSDSYPTQAL